MRPRIGLNIQFILLLVVVICAPMHSYPDDLTAPGDSSSSVMALDECITAALKNNHRRPASRYAVEMAEAQHRQALSGYWPRISTQASFLQMDEASNFLFPASSMALPMGGSLDVMIPGVGPVPVSDISIPSQNIKLMDESSFMASVGFSLLLFDGGMRKGYSEQTKALVEMMKQESLRTDLEIIDGVKRMYFGSVLAIRLHQVGKDTLERMEATLSLTESLYKEGSGTVKKTDWLDNKVMVETLRSMVALLEKNEFMAQAALANIMGMPWNTSIKPEDLDLPFTPLLNKLDDLVSTAYEFNIDWNSLEAGIRAASGAVRTAESGYLPKVALTGELHRWWNDYKAGMATAENKEGWVVGIGVEIPLFDGFLTGGRVSESRARVQKLQEQRLILKEGIGLLISDTFLTLRAAEKSYAATRLAKEAAEENQDLNTRAYQQGLVENQKVIQAQLMEALMTAQYYKALYDHNTLLSRLNLIVGTEVLRKLQ